MDVTIWNVLHDGKIAAADGVVPGDLRLSIEIAYLCEYLSTQGIHLVVTLVGCKRFDFQPYHEPLVSGPSAVAALGLELLDAEWLGEFVRIQCADGGYGGQLLLQYRSAQPATIEGRLLLLSEIESAAEQYWFRWQQKNFRSDRYS